MGKINDFLVQWKNNPDRLPLIIKGARPRQFSWECSERSLKFKQGQTLFVRSYFEGRKDLFEELAISKTETEWKEYPVFYFDFTGKNYETVDDVILKIGDTLEKLENIQNKKRGTDLKSTF